MIYKFIKNYIEYEKKLFMKKGICVLAADVMALFSLSVYGG